jgi:RNA polymerase sigma-70 factor (ECF subfamily)
MADVSADRSTRPSLLLRLREPQDGEAWNTCVDVYGPLIYGHCRRGGLGHADAEDVTQEVFIRLSTAIRTFEYQPDLGRFRTWLGTVTRNEIKRFLKKQRPDAILGADVTPVGEIAGAAEDNQWTSEFNAHVLEVALRRCRPRFEKDTWRAFERAWVENCPAAQVAQEMGRTIDWIYVAKSRVLKLLWQEVQELADDNILAAFSSD